jgi:hypothetical protein
LLNRVVPSPQFLVPGGCAEQQDDIEPPGVSFDQRLPRLPVDVDALAIPLAPFVEDGNLFALVYARVQREFEQVGTLILSVFDVFRLLIY